MHHLLGGTWMSSSGISQASIHLTKEEQMTLRPHLSKNAQYAIQLKMILDGLVVMVN
jgi:hypothetical protein